MVNQAILTADNPLADVMFGVDDTFLTRAIEAGHLRTVHQSSGLESVPDDLRACDDSGDTHRLRGRLSQLRQGRLLRSVAAAVGPRRSHRPGLRGMLVVEDPTTSSPGPRVPSRRPSTRSVRTAGSTYWTGLEENDTLVAPGWTEAYYGEFSGGAGEGDRPLVVSYASSPPAEVIFSETPLDEAPTGVITDGCYRQVEFAGILAGTDNPGPAGQLIDFMLSTAVSGDDPADLVRLPGQRRGDTASGVRRAHRDTDRSGPDGSGDHRGQPAIMAGAMVGHLPMKPRSRPVGNRVDVRPSDALSRLLLPLPAGPDLVAVAERRRMDRCVHPAAVHRGGLVHAVAGHGVDGPHGRGRAAVDLGRVPVQLPRARPSSRPS